MFYEKWTLKVNISNWSEISFIRVCETLVVAFALALKLNLIIFSEIVVEKSVLDFDECICLYDGCNFHY